MTNTEYYCDMCGAPVVYLRDRIGICGIIDTEQAHYPYTLIAKISSSIAITRPATFCPGKTIKLFFNFYSFPCFGI